MKLIKIIVLALVLAAVFTFPKALAFDLFGSACKGESKNSPACQQASSQKTNPVIDIINSAANIIAIVTGIVAVVMIIISGLTFITSGGSSEAVAASRRRLVYALVALVVVALAWTITRFITDKLIQ